MLTATLSRFKLIGSSTNRIMHRVGAAPLGSSRVGPVSGGKNDAILQMRDAKYGGEKTPTPQEALRI